MYRFVIYAMSIDSHKWVIGREVGKNGYKHLQARIRVSMGEDEAFKSLKERFPTAHIEVCSDTWDYERKSGDYLCSEDYDEWGHKWIMDKIKCRFGTETANQRGWSTLLEKSGDRDIVVFYDEKGKNGKSWWAIHWWEQGRAHVVNPSGTAKALMQDVASKYATQGYRPWVIIDIPRTWKWTNEIYYTLEKIKDGLISDPRYSATDINIRGVKVAVMCNKLPNRQALSDDRWFVWDVGRNWFADGYDRSLS